MICATAYCNGADIKGVVDRDSGLELSAGQLIINQYHGASIFTLSNVEKGGIATYRKCFNEEEAVSHVSEIHAIFGL